MMTGLTPDVAAPVRATTQPLGHPVRSFSLVLVAIAVLLLVVQASGLVLPRVTNPDGLAASGESVEGPAWSAAVITNDGLLSVRIESVRWPVVGAVNGGVELLPSGVSMPGGPSIAAKASPIEPFTLDPGERRVVVASGRPTCPGSFGTGALTVRARGGLGLGRRVVVRPAETTDVFCG